MLGDVVYAKSTCNDVVDIVVTVIRHNEIEIKLPSTDNQTCNNSNMFACVMSTSKISKHATTLICSHVCCQLQKLANMQQL